MFELRRLIAEHRERPLSAGEDPKIGCIMLAQPFFFRAQERFRAPGAWVGVQRGKGYARTERDGQYLFDETSTRLAARRIELTSEVHDAPPAFALVQVRPGQGIFRSMVADAYHRRCAVTGEKVLPALQAAHIKPYAESGPNSVNNGLLLRADIHNLFDEGYVALTPEFRFEVSRRVREDYENGRDYYALSGRQLSLPDDLMKRPSREFIQWHINNRFRG